MLLWKNCFWLSTVLNNIVEPASARNQVYNVEHIVGNTEQYCTHNILVSCIQQLLIFGRVHDE